VVEDYIEQGGESGRGRKAAGDGGEEREQSEVDEKNITTNSPTRASDRSEQHFRG